MKRFIAQVLAVCACCSAVVLTACNGEGIDKNKTQLYVGVSLDGVTGDTDDTWIDKLADAYEAEHSDIQVIIDKRDLEYNRTNLVVNIKYNRQDVYFINDYIAQNFITSAGASEYLVDMTDIVTEKIEGVSIEDRLYSDAIAYHNVGTETVPKYYSLPYFMSFNGTVYNKTLFETKNLYNLSGYKGLDCIEGNADDNYGPDGVQNTYDDGLPATFEDMKILIEIMVANNVIPFTWSTADYRNNWLMSIWASYEGKNDYRTLVNLNGTDSQFGEINVENAWKLAGQDGREAAIITADYITSNSLFYSETAFSSTQDSKKAQLEYISSYPRWHKNSQGNPIAFLVEGTWWENEANQEYFEQVADRYGSQYGYNEQDFGFFPWPKYIGTAGVADQAKNSKTVIASEPSISTTACFINKATSKEALAKDFIKFVYEQVNLSKFTKETGMFMPLDYELTTDCYNSLTSYTKDVYELLQNDNVEKVIPKVRNELMAAIGNVYDSPYSLKSLIATPSDGDVKLTDPLQSFYLYRNSYGLTAEKYINGKYRLVNETDWATMLDAIWR